MEDTKYTDSMQCSNGAYNLLFRCQIVIFSCVDWSVSGQLEALDLST